VIVQTSDTTWQAYNRYGIADVQATAGSLYCGGPISNAGSAYANACSSRSAKVSYNRPIDTRGHSPQSFLFNAEYPMVAVARGERLQRQVHQRRRYRTTRRRPGRVNQAKGVPLVGHDEYWSADSEPAWKRRAPRREPRVLQRQRDVLEDAVRRDHRRNGYRVSNARELQDTLAGVKLDPMPNVSTGTWRDLRFGHRLRDGAAPRTA